MLHQGRPGMKLGVLQLTWEVDVIFIKSRSWLSLMFGNQELDIFHQNYLELCPGEFVKSLWFLIYLFIYFACVCLAVWTSRLWIRKFVEPTAASCVVF